MTIFHCPGADKIKQPKPELINCPYCSGEVEIWTDEASAVCANCKKKLFKSSLNSCLDWCKYAKECAGEEVYRNYQKNKAIAANNQ